MASNPDYDYAMVQDPTPTLSPMNCIPLPQRHNLPHRHVQLYGFMSVCRILSPEGDSAPVGERLAPIPVGERDHLGSIDNHAGYLLQCYPPTSDMRDHIAAPYVAAIANVEYQGDTHPPILQRASSSVPHPFGANEDVMLAPAIFHAMCQNFDLAPKIDLFATSQHHQLAFYFSPDVTDQYAYGHNAFDYVWDPATVLYANPPWTLLDMVVDKILRDHSRLLLVAPFWKTASWYVRVRPVVVNHTF